MNGLSRYAGFEEPALACPVLDTGYLIRGHPETLEKTGFGLEFTPGENRGRNDNFLENR